MIWSAHGVDRVERSSWAPGRSSRCRCRARSRIWRSRSACKQVDRVALGSSSEPGCWPRSNRPGGRGTSWSDAHRGDGLPAPRLADDRERLARVDRHPHAVDRLDGAVRCPLSKETARSRTWMIGLALGSTWPALAPFAPLAVVLVVVVASVKSRLRCLWARARWAFVASYSGLLPSWDRWRRAGLRR